MDDIADRTVSRIFGGRDPMGPAHPEHVQLANYMHRVRTGKFDDLYARHSLDEMKSYMDAMESLRSKYGGG